MKELYTVVKKCGEFIVEAENKIEAEKIATAKNSQILSRTTVSENLFQKLNKTLEIVKGRIA